MKASDDQCLNLVSCFNVHCGILQFLTLLKLHIWFQELDNEPLQPDFIEANLDSAVMKSSLPDALKNVKDEDVRVVMYRG